MPSPRLENAPVAAFRGTDGGKTPFMHSAVESAAPKEHFTEVLALFELHQCETARRDEQFSDNRRRAMSQHQVRFMKRICDDTGHPHVCTQGVIEIRQAHTRDRAIQAAKHKFARMRKIKHWGMHADTLEVKDMSPTGGHLRSTLRH